MKKAFLKISRANWIELLIVIVTSLVVHAWSLSRLNIYGMDDYDFIYLSKFKNIVFTIFPHMAYNDRPVRDVFNTFLFQFLGFHYQLQHLILLSIHMFSAVLFYFLVLFFFRRIKAKESKVVTLVPFLSALIFAAWPKNYVTFWISASNDLLLVFFFLLTACFYCLYHLVQTRNKKILVFLSTIFLLWLSIRTKEAAALIPAILLLGKIGLELEGKNIWGRENIKIMIKKLWHSLNILDGFMVIMSALFLGRLAMLQAGKKMYTSPNDFYFYSLNLIAIAKKFMKYSIMYFDYTNEFMGWKITNSATPKIIGIFLLAIFLFSIYLVIWRKKYLLFITGLMYFVAISTVLPLINMTHVLYLYFPSLFLSLAVALTVFYLAEELKLVNDKIILFIKFSAVFLIVSLASTSTVQGFRGFWLVYSQRDQSVMADLKALPKPKDGTVFYLLNTDPNSHLFKHGDVTILNNVYENKNLQAKIVKNPSEIEKTEPYQILWLDYDKGHIYQVNK